MACLQLFFKNFQQQRTQYSKQENLVLNEFFFFRRTIIGLFLVQAFHSLKVSIRFYVGDLEVSLEIKHL